MRLSLFRVFVAPVIVTSRRWLRIAKSRCFARISLRFFSAAMMIRRGTLASVLFISRAVYESVSTIFSRSNPRPPLCRETSRPSTSTRFAFSRQENPPSILQRLRRGPCDSPPRPQRRRLTGVERGEESQVVDIPIRSLRWLHDDWNVSSFRASGTDLCSHAAYGAAHRKYEPGQFQGSECRVSRDSVPLCSRRELHFVTVSVSSK